MLVEVSRASGSSIIAIGHETKDGSMAGPSVARHEVDTLLVFRHIEMKKDGTPGKNSDIQTGWIRLQADGKNRDGDTAATWIYRMTERGLIGAEEIGDAEEEGSPKNRGSDRKVAGSPKGTKGKDRQDQKGRMERAVRSEARRRTSEIQTR
jgi:predicted ATP-dependent serine protease